MTLQEACRILAELHTSEVDAPDDYVVHMSVVPDFGFARYSHSEYIEAWGVVRDFGRTGIVE